jgi:SAM-dependent methyltransferase
VALRDDLQRARRLGLAGYARYRRMRLANRLIRVVNLVGPERHECPCCGWRGARFLDHVRETYRMKAAVCPRCRSHSRHRGLALYLAELLPQLGPRSAVLHFAPERSLVKFFAVRPGLRYFGVDLGPRAANACADITAIPFRTGTFDLVIASHVIEHVGDDRAALGELARVTASGGCALVMVPMVPRWRETETLEFGYPNPEYEGHWRIYGRDLKGKIEATGLRCTPLSFAAFIDSGRRQRFGIIDEALFVAVRPD